VFLSHCVLAQAVRANGLAKHFPAAITPVVQFCLDNDINMIQMPCPEVQCMAGGHGREPHGKIWYEKNGLRNTAYEIAKEQVAYMKDLVADGFDILAIIGIEFSPACAPSYLNKGPVVVKDQGIFIEELKKELYGEGMDVVFLGINARWHNKLKSDLDSILPGNVNQSVSESSV